MKNWKIGYKILFWIIIIVILVAIYNYKAIANKLGINLRKYCDGGLIPIYQDGGIIGDGSAPSNNQSANNINAGRHPHPFPNFQNVIVMPYSYNQCPDFSTRKAENRMIGGYNNIYIPNADGMFDNGCPSCIIYNAVTYYYNGFDGKGCYYQVNYNYVWPVFSFNNFGRGHGHGGPGGPGSGTGPGTGPGTGGGGGHGH